MLIKTERRKSKNGGRDEIWRLIRCDCCKEEEWYDSQRAKPEGKLRKFCSLKCFSLSQTKEKTEIICPICGKKNKKRIWPSMKKTGRGKYCSRECEYEGLRRYYADPQNNKRFKGWTIVRGYVRLNIKVIPKKDLWIVEPMQRKGERGTTILEHRYIMAKHLNRPLTPDEVVHHIDGNRQNNSLVNLQLLPKAKHNGAVHGKIKFSYPWEEMLIYTYGAIK